jgi:2-aminoethylphosphonate transport system ATP-binding protein
MTAAIRFDQICVDYGSTRALTDFSLEVATGETVALLGPSGSGKSTALKALAGFERPTSGRLFVGGRDVTDLPPHQRGLGIVVQQYALFPHMRVFDNVAFGLRARHDRKPDVARRVGEALEMVGMESFARRYPAELSGGQQQRVAIARALAIAPDVLLLDEPLSALDAKLRQDMIGELQGLRRDLPDVAMLYVTHDQVEAMSLAERIVVMRDGRIVDAGTASGLYRTPPSRFTASFLGDANLLPATVIDATTVRVGDLAVHCAGDDFAEELVVGPGWPGHLTAVQWRGSTYRLSVALDDGSNLRLDVAGVEALPAVGESISIGPVHGAGVLVPSDMAGHDRRPASSRVTADVRLPARAQS